MRGPLARLGARAARAAGRPQATVVLLTVVALAAVGMVAADDGGGSQQGTIEPAATLDPTSPAEPSATPAPEPTPVPTTPEPTATGSPMDQPTAQPSPMKDEAALTEPFIGLSTWIDIYDVEWTPQEQVDVAAAAGVDTIFLQSARHLSENDIDDAERFAAVLDAAKARGLWVIAWYIPDFIDPERDLRRAQAAISFTTPNGNRADGFGLDIELDDQTDLALRNERLLDLSAQLREWTGDDYPMAAVVLPPLQLELNQTQSPGGMALVWQRELRWCADAWTR